MSTVSIIGCGALASVFVQNFRKLGPDWKLVSIYGRAGSKKELFESRFNTRVKTDFAEFLDDAGQYVVEFAGGAAVKETCLPVLQSGRNYVCVSVGALADDAFFHQLQQAAEDSGSTLYIASGAIGGLDFLQTLTFSDSPYSVSIDTVKNPKSLENSPGLEGRTLSGTDEEIVFSGTAKEAIKGFPKNVNVAVAAQLASGGNDIRVGLVSDPNRHSNEHIIKVRSETLNAAFSFESRPNKANPKSSSSAALSVLALLKNLKSPIRYF